MFSYTPLRIVNLVYNKTDIPLQLEEYEVIWHRRSVSCHISLHILLAVVEYLLNISNYLVNYGPTVKITV